tara:strand:+ start:1836 stop:2123 length:288 start_codon:yes stop_codon:yes gene_type:complete
MEALWEITTRLVAGGAIGYFAWVFHTWTPPVVDVVEDSSLKDKDDSELTPEHLVNIFDGFESPKANSLRDHKHLEALRGIEKILHNEDLSLDKLD